MPTPSCGECTLNAMNRTAILAAASLGCFALASCNQANVTGSAKTYTFAAQTQPGYSAQAGTATLITLSTGDTSAVLLATGLRPFTGYVAQFHALGDATKSPCASGGAVLGDQGSQSVIGNTTVNSDGSGGLIIRGLSSTAGVTAAQYVELHEAGNPATVPLCADLTVKPTKQ